MKTRHALLLAAAAALVAGSAAWVVVPEPLAPRSSDAPVTPRFTEAAAPESRRVDAPSATRGADAKKLDATSSPPPAPARWDAEDPVGIVVFGTLRDGSRKPIGEISLTATSERGDKIECHGSREATFAFAGLAPGRWTIAASVQGFSPLEESLELAESPVFRRIDLVMKPLLRIAIRFVTPDGRPVAEMLRFLQMRGLMAYASRSAPSGPIPLTGYRGYERSEIGEWQTALFPRPGREAPPKGADGLLYVRESPPFFVSALLRHCVLVSVEVKAPTDELQLPFSIESYQALLASARLRLVDSESG